MRQAFQQPVRALIADGQVHPIPGTTFLTADNAVKVGRTLRATMATSTVDVTASLAPNPLFERVVRKSGFADCQQGVHTLGSSAIHVALLAALLWWTSGPTETAAVTHDRHEPARMVFLITPGPGGGGGGGGLKNPLPPRKVERKSPRGPRRRFRTSPLNGCSRRGASWKSASPARCRRRRRHRSRSNRPPSRSPRASS